MPEPLETVAFDVVGPLLVLYATPRDVTVAPPSELMSPPVLAPDAVIADALVVVRVGGLAAARLTVIV